MSSVVKETIYKLLIYNEALCSFEAIQWQNAMQNKYNALIKNYIWDIVYVPKD